MAVPLWRGLSRAGTAALAIAIPLASGACLHHGSRSASAAVTTRSQAPRPPSPAIPPGPPDTADTASIDSDWIDPSELSAPEDDSEVSGESGDSSHPGHSGARATWSLPSDSPAPAAQTPPLDGDFEPLPVAGQLDAWVSLPTGARNRRPVVIAIHGAGDRPERQCRGWRNVTSEYPFIVCPRGRAWPRYTNIGGARLLEYIDGALKALETRYPGYVDTQNPLLAGFSLGAAQATALAVQFPARFPRVALVEGATKVWNSARVSAFVQGGGQRVLFGCGQDGVRDRAKRTAKQLTSLGVDTHVVFANVGHRFAPSLQDAVRGELAWLMDGDGRWAVSP